MCGSSPAAQHLVVELKSLLTGLRQGQDNHGYCPKSSGHHFAHWALGRWAMRHVTEKKAENMVQMPYFSTGEALTY
jgi:hypothetical protein